MGSGLKPSKTLFVSHSAADQVFAEALEQAIHDLLESKTEIDVSYSSSAKVGPEGGESWRKWINEQVVSARSAIVVVTPASVAKPWLLWEAGACRGASLARQAGRAGPDSLLLVTLAYGLRADECPDPLRGEQIITGVDEARVEKLFGQLLEHHQISTELSRTAGKNMVKAVSTYLETVERALLKAPSLVTEANIQDWLARLEELVVKDDRGSELQGFQQWLDLAFGREGPSATVPIDVRIHRRLGELYLQRKDYARAVTQLSLARRLAPRDIYILRPLSEAYMKRSLLQSEPKRAPEEITEVFEAIEELDGDAFVANPDTAALYGKYYRLVLREPSEAIKTFRKALKHNPKSYYLADVLAQTQLECGDEAGARKTYRQALNILDGLDESNIWTYATAATAHIVLGEQEFARVALRKLAGLRPSTNEIASVRRGVSGVAGYLKVSPSDLEDLLGLLQR